MISSFFFNISGGIFKRQNGMSTYYGFLAILAALPVFLLLPIAIIPALYLATHLFAAGMVFLGVGYAISLIVGITSGSFLAGLLIFLLAPPLVSIGGAIASAIFLSANAVAIASAGIGISFAVLENVVFYTMIYPVKTLINFLAQCCRPRENNNIPPVRVPPARRPSLPRAATPPPAPRAAAPARVHAVPAATGAAVRPPAGVRAVNQPEDPLLRDIKAQCEQYYRCIYPDLKAALLGFITELYQEYQQSNPENAILPEVEKVFEAAARVPAPAIIHIPQLTERDRLQRQIEMQCNVHGLLANREERVARATYIQIEYAEFQRKFPGAIIRDAELFKLQPQPQPEAKRVEQQPAMVAPQAEVERPGYSNIKQIREMLALAAKNAQQIKSEEAAQALETLKTAGLVNFHPHTDLEPKIAAAFEILRIDRRNTNEARKLIAGPPGGAPLPLVVTSASSSRSVAASSSVQIANGLGVKPASVDDVMEIKLDNPDDKLTPNERDKIKALSNEALQEIFYPKEEAKELDDDVVDALRARNEEVATWPSARKSIFDLAGMSSTSLDIYKMPMLLPCGHLEDKSDAHAMKNCPMCRAPYKKEETVPCRTLLFSLEQYYLMLTKQAGVLPARGWGSNDAPACPILKICYLFMNQWLYTEEDKLNMHQHLTSLFDRMMRDSLTQYVTTEPTVLARCGNGKMYDARILRAIIEEAKVRKLEFKVPVVVKEEIIQQKNKDDETKLIVEAKPIKDLNDAEIKSLMPTFYPSLNVKDALINMTKMALEKQRAAEVASQAKQEPRRIAAP